MMKVFQPPLTKLTTAKFSLKTIQVAREKCAKLMVFVSDCQLLIVFIRPLVEQSVLCPDNFRLLFFWVAKKISYDLLNISV